jgi:predicted O-methyltransferase YrrM
MNKIDLDNLVNRASSKELREKQYATFMYMEPSINMPINSFQQIAQLEKTDYTSVRTILGAFTEMALPKTYLEIGTRRGHSLCMVVNCSTGLLDVYSFDIWSESYAGEANPGPELIKKELEKINFMGNIYFFNGDSKKTIPDFFQYPLHPKEIDLIFVDGDHSDEGARTDLLNVVDHVSIGGLIVFDDITHPAHPGLMQVWHKVMANRPNFELRESTKYPYGWAVALRLY